MTMFIRHLLIRGRMLCTDGGSLAMLLIAGASSYIIWPWTLHRAAIDVPGIDIFVMLLGLLIWPFMVGVVIHGRNFGDRGSVGAQIATEHPVPALPIKPYCRVLAESLAALAIILILRLPGFFLGEIGRSFIGAPESAMSGGAYAAWFSTQTLVSVLVYLPPLIAWCTPSRNHVYYLLRPITISMPLFAAIMLGVAEHPLVCVALSLPLAALTLLTGGWEPSPARGRVEGASSVARLYRTALEPRARLRRDQWLQPLRVAWPYLAFIIPVEIVVLMLGEHAERPIPWRGLIDGASTGLLLTLIVLRPVGLQLLKPVHSPSPTVTGRATLMDGWSLLPVLRESVTRGIYLHVLLGGALLVSLGYARGVCERLIGTDTGAPSLVFNPFVFSIPVMAGLAVSLAVGDRLRTAISFTTLIAFLPVHIFVFVRLRAAGMSASEFGPGMAIDLGILALMSLIGSVPPLVHLRRPAWRRRH